MKWLALGALLIALPASAQMYKCVDERGVVHYTDKPTPGCKGGPVDIQPIPPLSGQAGKPQSPNTAQQDADFNRRQIERERQGVGDLHVQGGRMPVGRQGPQETGLVLVDGDTAQGAEPSAAHQPA